ncbi:ROK family transcriptional regulator [Paenibacillus athensensis]|uniref:ROK family protein n=1 Tax=Paenibacillus athensensis TaxID=1967502 RepID=A0A4Y8Q2F0_9BACL|nr:ROK family transcriptional regulator [Paenibacillus athensensis]MCD1258639.1 ROK family transcriptional regulator [Paenibacillus athensensis]
MKQTGDLNLVKKINKSIVLHHIRKDSPISRARIAEISGLTKATVSSLVNELIESKLAHEIGTGESSGGRKPMLLLFNGTAGYAIGIDLGVRYVHAVLTDLTGQIVQTYRVRHDNRDAGRALEALKSCVRELQAGAPASPYGIVGIGIGIPGVSDGEGRVLFAPNLGWPEGLPLQQQLEEAFGIPVAIDNEANAGAIGEKQFGAGQDSGHLVYVSIGTGIGAGLVMKGELYRGASGFSGELGHMSIQHDGSQCRCGSLGCWELYASESALLEQARLALGAETELEALLRLAEGGDETAIGLFERLGYYLGVGVGSIVNGYNPELVVLGGRLAAAERWLLRPLLAQLERRSLRLARSGVTVRFAELGDRSTVLGASSFAIAGFFASSSVTVAGSSYL